MFWEQLWGVFGKELWYVSGEHCWYVLREESWYVIGEQYWHGLGKEVRYVRGNSFTASLRYDDGTPLGNILGKCTVVVRREGTLMVRPWVTVTVPYDGFVMTLWGPVSVGGSGSRIGAAAPGHGNGHDGRRGTWHGLCNTSRYPHSASHRTSHATAAAAAGSGSAATAPATSPLTHMRHVLTFSLKNVAHALSGFFEAQEAQ